MIGFSPSSNNENKLSNRGSSSYSFQFVTLAKKDTCDSSPIACRAPLPGHSRWSAQSAPVATARTGRDQRRPGRTTVLEKSRALLLLLVPFRNLQSGIWKRTQKKVNKKKKVCMRSIAWQWVTCVKSVARDWVRKGRKWMERKKNIDKGSFIFDFGTDAVPILWWEITHSAHNEKIDYRPLFDWEIFKNHLSFILNFAIRR